MEEINVEVASIISNLILERLNYCSAKQNELNQKNARVSRFFINYLKVLGVETENMKPNDVTLLFNEMMNDLNIVANDKSYLDTDLIKIINKKKSEFLYIDIKDKRKKININRFVFIILTSLVIGLLFSSIYKLIKLNYKRVN